MIGNLIAIVTLAVWLPNPFNFDMSQWMGNLNLQPVVISPIQTPPPFIFNNPTTQPTTQPKPASTPKPTLKPSSSPTTTPTSGLTAQSVLSALNNYRAKNGVGPLSSDQKLQNYAQSRSDYLKSIGKMDNHAGFSNYVQNQNGFAQLGFNALAENQSWNYKGDAQGLISQFYASSPGHNQNQLNGTYTHVGIGISGVFTDIVFGGSKR